jgi:hypothetical protein
MSPNHPDKRAEIMGQKMKQNPPWPGRFVLKLFNSFHDKDFLGRMMQGLFVLRHLGLKNLLFISCVQ